MIEAFAGNQESATDAHAKDEVDITVNGTRVSVHRGHRTVAEIKAKAGVPAADVLAQVVDGQLTPLPADGAVVLKGGEVFLSYPPDAGSSSRPPTERGRR